MKLTPLDIRKHEFSRSFRGYDVEETRAFLEMLSQQWDELKEELRQAQDRVRELEVKIAHYEKVEEALQEALESARVNAQRTQTNAEERARLTVEEAELRAEQILRESEQERFRLRQDVSKLTHRHAEVTARLRHFLMSELEVLAQHEDERPVGFMKLIPSREAEALPPPEPQGQGAAQQSPPGPAPEAEAPAEKDPRPESEATTYADMFARAARRGHERAEQPPPQPEQPPEDEPGWTLRSLVSQEEADEVDDRDDDEPSQRDHIRRIIEDLD